MKKKKVILTGVLALMGVIGYISLRVNNGGHKFSDLELANIEALAESEKVPNVSPYGDVIVGCQEKEYLECRVICNTLGCGNYYVANSVNGIAKQVKGRCKKCGGSSFRSF